MRTVTTYFISGPTSTGKTSYVFTKYKMENVYDWSPALRKGLWFDGYNGEKVLLIDEFCLQDVPVPYLLRLLDNYPMDLQVKNGMTSACWDTVILISNLDPEAALPALLLDPEVRKAIFHRISYIGVKASQEAPVVLQPNRPSRMFP